MLANQPGPIALAAAAATAPLVQQPFPHAYQFAPQGFPLPPQGYPLPPQGYQPLPQAFQPPPQAFQQPRQPTWAEFTALQQENAALRNALGLQAQTPGLVLAPVQQPEYCKSPILIP